MPDDGLPTDDEALDDETSLPGDDRPTAPPLYPNSGPPPVWQARLGIDDDDIDSGWERHVEDGVREVAEAKSRRFAEHMSTEAEYIDSFGVRMLANDVHWWAPKHDAAELHRRLTEIAEGDNRADELERRAAEVRALLGRFFFDPCTECGRRPIKYKKTRLCSTCSDYRRTHHGQARPGRPHTQRGPE